MTDRTRRTPPEQKACPGAGARRRPRGVERGGRVRLATLALCFAVLGSPSIAHAQSAAGSFDRFGGYAFDALILRPASFCRLIIGSVALVVAYPLALPSGNQQIVLERCTLDPFEDTFRRGLGDF